MKKLLSPRAMMILSMAIFGTISPFVKHIAVSSGELALYRALLALLLLGGYLAVSGQKIDFRYLGRELPLLLISGMAMGINWILLFESYKYTTVSAATLSYYFAPILVTLACPFLFKEKISRKQWICFIMSTIGIILITGIGDMSHGSDHLKGILLALGAAFLYAFVILINKFIKRIFGIQRTFLQFAAAIIALLPYVWAGGVFSLPSLNASGWVCLLIVGLVHTGINYCLYFTALKDMPGQEAAILSYTDPLVAIIISVTLLNEPMTVNQLVGGAMILGFTLWNELEPKQQ